LVNIDKIATNKVKHEDGWIRSPGRAGQGFLDRFKVEYQEKGGGSLTTAAIIECVVEKRGMRVDGKSVTIRVSRVLSYASKLQHPIRA